MANFFIGKIPPKKDRQDPQLTGKYYEADQGWFNGLQVGDYAFIVSGSKVLFWQAKKWENQPNGGVRMNFNELVGDCGIRPVEFTALKFFNLDVNNTVKLTRSTASEKKAFFKLSLDNNNPIDISQISNPIYLKNNFRKIFLYSSLKDANNDTTATNDIQVYQKNSGFDIINKPFIQWNNSFISNPNPTGPKKENTKKKFTLSNGVSRSEIKASIQAFYDLFYSETEPSNTLGNTTPSITPKNANPGSLTSQTSVKKHPLNLILYGPPGTGKTYHTIDKALEIIEGKNSGHDTEKFNDLKNKGRIVFTTFHQSMSYEDFIEGIKPETDEDGNVTYEIKPGIFKQLCQKANPPQQDNFEEAWGKLVNDLIQGNTVQIPPIVKSNFSPFEIVLCKNGSSVKDVNNDSKTLNYKRAYEYYKTNQSDYYQSYYEGLINLLKRDYNLHDYKAPDYKSEGTDVNQETNHNTIPYVLIIDEINRGNVANIFGELITLIEDDKRGKLSVKLPYSNEDFSVPKNLYIIGTMNTADRSVEALDTALRRRFSFEEMMPKPALLGEYKIKNGNVDFCTFKDILEKINSRIEVLKDRDHLIGHSYFMIKVKDDQGNEIDKESFNLNDENDKKMLISIFFDKIIPLLQEYFYGDYEKIQMVLGNGFVNNKKPDVIFAGNKTFDELQEQSYSIVDFDRNNPNTFDLTNALALMMNKNTKEELDTQSNGES